jgi:hypothetical protein
MELRNHAGSPRQLRMGNLPGAFIEDDADQIAGDALFIAGPGHPPSSIQPRNSMKKFHFVLILGVVLSAAPSLMAANIFGGSLVDPIKDPGQLVLTRTTNLLQVSQTLQSLSLAATSPETPKVLPQYQIPAVSGFSLQTTAPSGPSLTISPTSSFGFNAVSHYDQRMANGGNQFSTEPATPGVAVGNGYILEGVDDAIQIFSTSGTPLLPNVVTINQLLQEPVQINRTTGFNGVFTTDTRVFWDPDIQRFMVLVWSQANDSAGNPLSSSQEWLAVTQTADPTGVWNIYIMDSTDANHDGVIFPHPNGGCPCVPDYPQIGADAYGFYISSNEFNVSASFSNASILAISKSQLGSGAVRPTTVKFMIFTSAGYEFAIQPAITPPGASYFMASGGAEYFASSRSGFSAGTNVAVWSMTNTSSLNTASPNLTLTQILVPTEEYDYPNSAVQKEGTRPYGTNLVLSNPPFPNFGALGAPFNEKLAFLDGGPDSRVLSLFYAGGRLYLSMQAEVTDQNGKSVVGGAYMIISPALRATLTASVVRQGYLLTNGQHLLRPVIAVNAQGRGAVVFTLVGPNYYPSAAYVPINLTTTGTAIQLVGPGSFPEDGFTGYCPGSGQYGCLFGTGIARWGDNSAAVISSDGSLWGVTGYIPNAPRTPLANWGTFLMQIAP